MKKRPEHGTLAVIPKGHKGAPAMHGSLSVLSCGRGDMHIGFDKGDRDGMERAREVIRDMLACGYMLFVQMKDGRLRQVQKFDHRSFSYVLKKAGAKETTKRKVERVPARKRKAFGVAPTAGG